MRRRLAVLACIGWLIPAAVSAQNISGPRTIMGRWWTQDHDGVVDIQPCAAGVCGRVVGITEFGLHGETPLDYKGRSRCNLLIVVDGTREDDGTWDSHITNPDDGKVYTITMRIDPNGQLRMRGYIGIPLFGKTVFWTRFTGRLTTDCHIGG